jgi:hypothetical protein
VRRCLEKNLSEEEEAEGEYCSTHPSEEEAAARVCDAAGSRGDRRRPLSHL